MTIFWLHVVNVLAGVSYGYFLMEISISNNESYDYDFCPTFKKEDHAMIISFLNIVFSLGGVVGTLIGGYTCYRFGRVITAIYSDFIALIAITLGAFIHDFSIFTISRLLKGVYVGINYPIIIILFQETLRNQSLLDKFIIIFQTSTTVGILLANLIFLTKNWILLMFFPICFSGIRLCYFIYLKWKKNFETNLYQSFKKEKEFDNYKTIQSHKHSRKYTLLNNKFTLGDLFGPKFFYKTLFCFLILIVDQLSGINVFLQLNIDTKGVHYHSLIVGIFNFIGGLFILLPWPQKQLNRDFYRFSLGFCILLTFLFCIIYVDHLFTCENCGYLHGAYVFLYQILESYYAILIAASLMPDIGISVIMIFHWIMSLIINLIPLNDTEDYKMNFKFFCWIGIGVMLLVFLIYTSKIRKCIAKCYKNDNN